MTSEGVRKPDGGAWQYAADFGIDMRLLEDLMALSPTERFWRHQRALNLVRALREAGIRHYGFDPRDPGAAEAERR